MDQSLISLDELIKASKGLNSVRKTMFNNFFEASPTIYPYSLVVRVDEPYRGAGVAMKFSFPNNSFISADQKKQLETWKLMSAIFPALIQYKYYHFLCFRDKADKKKNYYPILLVEEVSSGNAKGRSATMAKLSEDNPMEYLAEVERANTEWINTP